MQAEEDLVQVAEDAPNLKISPKVFKTLNVFVTACYRWPPWIDHLYPLNSFGLVRSLGVLGLPDWECFNDLLGMFIKFVTPRLQGLVRDGLLHGRGRREGVRRADEECAPNLARVPAAHMA